MFIEKLSLTERLNSRETDDFFLTRLNNTFPVEKICGIKVCDMVTSEVPKTGKL